MSTEDEQHDEVEHVDEKWLVSYADMMTLLFGLFVMLYSIAMEHQGDISSQLQKISEEKFTDQSTDSNTTQNNTQPPLQDDAEKLKEEIEKLKVDLSAVQTTLNESETQKIQQTEQTEALQKENLLLKEKVESLQSTKSSVSEMLAEKDLLQNKIKEQESKMLELENQLKQSRAIASVPAPVDPTKDKDAQMALHLRDHLQKLEAQLKNAQQQIQDKQDQLEKKDQQLQEQQQAMQNQKPPEPEGPQTRNFGLVLMKWSTKSHDLDMVIKDPNGRKFDFQNRTHGTNPGEFVLDSRTGPGAEIWQSEKLIPGNYELQINLYQSYGNTAPAEASVSFQTPYSNAEIGKIILTEKQPNKTLRFTVDKDGRVIQN